MMLVRNLEFYDLERERERKKEILKDIVEYERGLIRIGLVKKY